MKIVAKKGFEIEIQVSGFQGRGFYDLKASFNFSGKTVNNEECKIVRNGKIVEGIFLSRLNGYVECMVSEIEKAISKLPVKVKMFEPRERDIDGVVIMDWIRNDGLEVSGFMRDFLRANYNEAVSVEESTAKYEAERVVKESSAKIENIMFDNESEGIDRFNGIETA